MQKAKGTSCGGGNKAPPIASHLRQRFWWGTQDQEIPFGRQKADGNWHIANGRRQRAFMQKGNIDGSRFQYLARVLIDLATAIKVNIKALCRLPSAFLVESLTPIAIGFWLQSFSRVNHILQFYWITQWISIKCHDPIEFLLPAS